MEYEKKEDPNNESRVMQDGGQCTAGEAPPLKITTIAQLMEVLHTRDEEYPWFEEFTGPPRNSFRINLPFFPTSDHGGMYSNQSVYSVIGLKIWADTREEIEEIAVERFLDAFRWARGECAAWAPYAPPALFWRRRPTIMYQEPRTAGMNIEGVWIAERRYWIGKATARLSIPGVDWTKSPYVTCGEEHPLIPIDMRKGTV